MPANPDNVERRVVISEEYQDLKVHVDVYSNSAIRVYRADPNASSPDDDGIKHGSSVWLDNIEKRELLTVLEEEINE